MGWLAGVPAASANIAATPAPSLYGSSKTLLPGLNYPTAVAVDAHGDVFVPNALNNQVVEFPKGGPRTILPFMGLDGPAGVAVDASGDVFVTDAENNRVVELTANGAQETVGFHGLNRPAGIALDPAGDIFVNDVQNDRVEKLSTTGVQTTEPFPLLNGVAIGGTGVAVDNAGDVFVVNSSSGFDVTELHPNGTTSIIYFNVGITGLATDAQGDLYVATLTGGYAYQKAPFSGSSSTEVWVLMAEDTGIALDGSGNVYLEDMYGSLVTERTPTGAVSTIPSASMSIPMGVAVNAAGSVFVDSTVTSDILQIEAGGTATVAVPDVEDPSEMAFDGAGTMYVLDNGNQVLVIPVSGPASTLTFSASDLGGIAVDAAGDVFATDYLHRVLEIPAGGTQVTVPVTGLNGADGVAVDAAGDLFVTDEVNDQVVELPHGGVQRLLPMGYLRRPVGVAVDHAGDVFVDDNSRVLELLKGSTKPIILLNGLVTDGMAVDPAGDVFLSDLSDNSVIELPLSEAVFVNPVNGQLNVDTTQPFQWSSLPGAQAYFLVVGTSVFGDDLVDSGVLPATTTFFAVPALPAGQVLYATLLTEDNGAWSHYQLVGFIAAPR